MILQDDAPHELVSPGSGLATAFARPKGAVVYTSGKEGNFAMPVVSVIINVLNGAHTLTEAVESVRAQTFDDWELIVWDDCSTDGSSDVLSRYEDSRIRYFRSEGQVCLGRARQHAIDLARSDWIAFLDQDDLWLPYKLERQLSLAGENPDAALIYGRTVRFYPSGSERDYDQAHEYTCLPEGDIFIELFTNSCFIAMSSAMFRRSAVSEIGGIPDSISIIPDYYLYTAIAHRFPAAAVQQVVCRYRMHPGNSSRTTAMQVQEEALRLVDTWQGELTPEILVQYKRRHSTAIALLEMRHTQTFFHGVWRLLTQGAAMSQMLRPFHFVVHLVRRTVQPPLWKTLGPARVSLGSVERVVADSSRH